MSHAGFDWRILLSAAGALTLAAAGALYWWRRRPVDLAAAERRRRSHLNQVGRIVEGQVIEILDVPAPPMQPNSGRRFLRKRRPPSQPEHPHGGRKLVHYTYSISGVTYETVQDVTGLEARVCLERLAAGQPASVKYDPAKPSNSILVADDWSGLQ